tara:strand:- start:3571 stop:6018 length:2448 start_codon:yes stop_codon:yes gene_type:complete
MPLQIEFTEDGRLQMQGTFEDLQMGQLLLWLFHEKQTGELYLETPQFQQRLYVSEGYPTGTRGGPQENYLGWLLMERNMIDEATYYKSLELMTSKQLPQGQVLCQLGVINDEQLIYALTLQLQRKLIRLFYETNANFVFFSTEHPPVLDIPAGHINPYSIVGHGLRQSHDDHRLLQLLMPVDGKAIRLRPVELRDISLEALDLEEHEQAALPLIEEWTTLDDFIDEEYLDTTEALVLVCILHLCDVLDIDEINSHPKLASAARLRKRQRPQSATPDFTSVTSQPRSSSASYVQAVSNADTEKTDPSLPGIDPELLAEITSSTPSVRVSPQHAQWIQSSPSPPKTRSTTPDMPYFDEQTAASLEADLEGLEGEEEVKAFTYKPTPEVAPKPPSTPAVLSMGPPQEKPQTPSTEKAHASSPKGHEAPAVISMGPPPNAPSQAAAIEMPPPPPNAPEGVKMPPPPPRQAATTPAPAVISAAPPSTPPQSSESAAIAMPPPPPSHTAQAPNSVLMPPPPPGREPSKTTPPAVIAIGPPPNMQPRSTPSADSAPSKTRPETSTTEPPARTEPNEEEKQLLANILEKHKAVQDANYYEILEVKQDASSGEIRKAYIKLSRTFHPDLVAGTPLEAHKKKLDLIFSHLNEAHAILSKEDQRKEYDETQLDPEMAELHQYANQAAQAEVFYTKAMVFLKMRDHEAALEQLHWACKLMPEEGDYNATYAWTLYKNPKGNKDGLREEVKEKLLKAEQQGSAADKANLYLGFVFKDEGDQKMALRHFEKVLEAHPRHAEASREVRYLKMAKKKKEPEKKGLFGRRKK